MCSKKNNNVQQEERQEEYLSPRSSIWWASRDALLWVGILMYSHQGLRGAALRPPTAAEGVAIAAVALLMECSNSSNGVVRQKLRRHELRG
eukprot:1188922-Prorocentrum_minimum.AAC.3